jgi:hypothetical protein
MIRVILSHSEGTATLSYDTTSVSLRGDRLVVDGTTVATKWGTVRGPWLVGGRPFDTIEFLEVTS